MKFTEVKELPETIHSAYKKNRYIFEEFMKTGIRIARVDFTTAEYSSSVACSAHLRKSAKRFGFPVNVLSRNGEVYFIRRDM